MKIQYSHHIFSSQTVGGISNYFVDLAESMTDRNNLVKEFTSNNQIPLIDFYSISIANKDYYSQDYLHFNNRGVTAQAELMCTEINRILKK